MASAFTIWVMEMTEMRLLRDDSMRLGTIHSLEIGLRSFTRKEFEEVAGNLCFCFTANLSWPVAWLLRRGRAFVSLLRDISVVLLPLNCVCYSICHADTAAISPYHKAISLQHYIDRAEVQGQDISALDSL